jgi:chlorite dismutase
MDIQRAKPIRGLDISERGRSKDGDEISLDRRLYMQFMAYGRAPDLYKLPSLLDDTQLNAVLYADLNDPHGFGLLTFSEDPVYFLEKVHHLLRSAPFSDFTLKPEFTMFGRTYSIGYEDDLERVLIDRPIERITDPSLLWAVWYPVRRSGAFEHLSPDEQRRILMEHGGIGRAYGMAGLAYDVRLACFGLDKNDNDFVVGLFGKNLFPLSKIVERMRKTRQTSLYLTNLGPFFIGKVVWQTRLKST